LPTICYAPQPAKFRCKSLRDNLLALSGNVGKAIKPAFVDSAAKTFPPYLSHWQADKKIWKSPLKIRADLFVEC